MVREWAEVPYVPTCQYERRDSQPYRYLAIRARCDRGNYLRMEPGYVILPLVISAVAQPGRQ